MTDYSLVLQKAIDKLKKKKEYEVIRVEEVIEENVLVKRELVGYLNMDEAVLRKHTFIVGASGSGKSVLLKRIIRQFLAEQEYYDKHDEFIRAMKKVIIHDTKGDYVQEFYDEKNWIILNPFDVRGYGFNVFETLKSITDIDKLCGGIVPMNDKAEPIWRNSAIDILKGIIFVCIEKGQLTNDDIVKYINLTFQDLAYALSYVVEENGKPKRYPYQGAEAAFNHLTSTQAGNLYSNFTSYMEFFKKFAGCKKEINIEKYVKEEKRNLILANFDNLQESLAPIHTIFLDQITSVILDLKEDENRSIVMILDEFASLKKSPAILKLLRLGRSFGAILFIGIQEFAPLQTLYDKEVATFKNNTQTKIFFSIGDNETQKEIVNMIGKQEVKITNDSNSSGIESNKDGISNSTQRITREAVLDAEVRSLKDHQFFYIQKNISEFDKKTGLEKSYVGKIHGGIDKEVDFREKISEAFILREELKLKSVTDHFDKINKKLKDLSEGKVIPSIDKEEIKTEVIKEEIVGQVLNGPDEEISKEVKENKKMNNEEINKIKQKLLLKKDIKKNEETLVKKEEKNISDLFESYNEDEEDSILKDFQDQINSLDEKDNPYN